MTTKAKKITIDALALMVARGFENTSTKLDMERMDARIDGMEKRLAGVEKRLERVESVLVSNLESNTEARIEDLETSVLQLKAKAGIK